MKHKPTDVMQIEPIAYIRTDFSQKFGIPRQSMLLPELVSTIVFEPAYRNPDALRGVMSGGDMSEAAVNELADWNVVERPVIL